MHTRAVKSADFTTSAGSQNLYTYVGNNPTNYVDPTGHKRMGNEDDEEKKGFPWIIFGFATKKIYDDLFSGAIPVDFDTDMVAMADMYAGDQIIEMIETGEERFINDLLITGGIFGVTTPIKINRDMRKKQATFYANIKNIIAASLSSDGADVMLYPMGTYGFDEGALEQISLMAGYGEVQAVYGEKYWHEMNDDQRDEFVSYIYGRGDLEQYRKKVNFNWGMVYKTMPFFMPGLKNQYN